jgi:hypothetical protein
MTDTFAIIRHSGEGRNPACLITPRSGQSLALVVVPLMEPLTIRLGWQTALHSHLTKLANYANQVIG